MVEGRVPPHTPGKLLSNEQAQGQSRGRRTEHVTNNGHQSVCNRHWPKAWHDENDDGPERQHGKRKDDCAPLGVGLVDRRADWCLDRKAEKTANGCYQADLGLAPMLLGNQENVQVRPKRATHIGEQEVDGVERTRVETGALRLLCHRDSHRVPMASVISVSGAPTRK
jgi:hypothetical protein